MAKSEHQPVLLDEALAGLAIRPDGCYVDATFGRGGHSAALLDRLSAEGRVVAFDRDPEAEQLARQMMAEEARLSFVRGSFADLAQGLAGKGIDAVDGVLFDLGVSSPQFDIPERGFSFRHAGPLDMRMNPDAGAPLSAWLAGASHGEIARVIKTLGEEPMAGRIAAAIIAARDGGHLNDTVELAEVVRGAIPARIAAGKRIHPATRTFQAFRMHVNGELAALDTGLAAALRMLAPGARLVVISFHSLEDRRVKRFFRHQAQPTKSVLPMVPESEPALRLIGKPVTPGGAECAANPRARSAIMRVAERTSAPEVTV